MSKCKLENKKLKITQIITSPLAGEVCFPFETELKTRKQGEGYLPPFNILFSSPSLVLELKAEPIKTKQPPAQGLRKQYIEQENNLPLSKGEDAVLLAQASYKCGEGVYSVGSKLGGKVCYQ